MSSNSLNDSSIKYPTKSSSLNDGSEESNGYSDSGRCCTEDKFSIGSIAQLSIYESIQSTQSAGTKISPISIAVNSIDGKIESAVEIEDTETSTKRLQTDSDSFDSHTHSSQYEKTDLDSKKMIGEQLDGDLQLPLAEEQDTNAFVCGTKTPCSKKGIPCNDDPIENLVSATLAFREASHNQCDLLRAQTSAINRLATAIEDQNVMMSRFHSVVVQKTNAKNYRDDDSPSSDDKP